MLKSIFLTATVLLTGCASTLAPLNKNEAEEQAQIKSVVLDYFQGSQLNDRPRLESAFALDVATMTGVDVGPDGNRAFVNYDMVDMMGPFTSGNPNTAASDNYEFLDIEVIDERMATVAFKSNTEWLDALTLLKIDDTWKIVSKSYIPQSVE